MGEKPCKDCGINTHRRGGNREFYLVTNEVWAEAHKPEKPTAGYLCIGCIEKRLRRELNAADFVPAPINYAYDYSERLKSRIMNGITAEQIEYAKKIILEEIEFLENEAKKLDKLKQEIPFD